jgi:chromosome segregation ATPase
LGKTEAQENVLDKVLSDSGAEIDKCITELGKGLEHAYEAGNRATNDMLRKVVTEFYKGAFETLVSKAVAATSEHFQGIVARAQLQDQYAVGEIKKFRSELDTFKKEVQQGYDEAKKALAAEVMGLLVKYKEKIEGVVKESEGRSRETAEDAKKTLEKAAQGFAGQIHGLAEGNKQLMAGFGDEVKVLQAKIAEKVEPLDKRVADIERLRAETEELRKEMQAKKEAYAGLEASYKSLQASFEAVREEMSGLVVNARDAAHEVISKAKPAEHGATDSAEIQLAVEEVAKDILPKMIEEELRRRKNADSIPKSAPFEIDKAEKAAKTGKTSYLNTKAPAPEKTEKKPEKNEEPKPRGELASIFQEVLDAKKPGQ